MRPDTTSVSTIGQSQAIDGMRSPSGATTRLTANGIVARYHERGPEQLANRTVKAASRAQRLFKRFAPDATRHARMRAGPYLSASFEEDNRAPAIAVGSHAGMVRRRSMDMAGINVSQGENTISKVFRTCMESLR